MCSFCFILFYFFFFFFFFNKDHVLSVSPLKTNGIPLWTMSIPTVVTVLDCINLSMCMRENRNLNWHQHYTLLPWFFSSIPSDTAHTCVSFPTDMFSQTRINFTAFYWFYHLKKNTLCVAFLSWSLLSTPVNSVLCFLFLR